MSPRTRITTLNLGSQSIELAEFRTQARGGLVLCGYQSRELLADPARVGLGPGHIEEAPLMETVAPGACTAIVRGNNRTNGVGLVEVYHFPQPTPRSGRFLSIPPERSNQSSPSAGNALQPFSRGRVLLVTRRDG